MIRATRSGIKPLAGREDDVGMSVLQSRDGGYIVAGRTASFGKGGDDIWLLKTDSRGEELWNATFGGKQDDAGFQVVELETAMLWWAGQNRAPIRRGSFSSKWILRAKRLWERTYRGSSASSLQSTCDGGFIIAGRIDNKETGRDALIIKTDSTGSEEWSMTSGRQRRRYRHLCSSEQRWLYMLAGITSSYGIGSEDAWLVKIRTEAKNLTDAVDMQNATTLMDRKVVESKFALNLAYTNTSNMSSNITTDIDADVVRIDISDSNPEKKSSKLAKGNDPSSSRRLSDIEKIFKDRLR